MNRFLRNIALFSVGLIACFSTMYAINVVTSVFNAPRVESETLIVGNSHMQQALNPAFFESAQNISQSAEPLYVTYWKLKKLLPLSSVSTVVLGFSYLNLSPLSNRKLSDERWSTTLFNRVYTIADIESLEGVEVDRLEFYRSKFKNMCLYPKWDHASYMGEYFNFDKSVLSPPDEDIARHYLRDGENVDISMVDIAFLDSIVALSARENVELILVAAPIHESYFKRIPDHFIAGFEDTKRELEARGIRVLDYSKLDVADEEFLNVTHLNERGATRFSKLISKRIDTSE